MLNAGKAIKVSIYLNEGSRHHSTASEASILDYLLRSGVSGASVFKGIAGFGADHHLHSASLVELSDHLPVKIEFIETQEKVDQVMPRLIELAGTGLIDAHETIVLKPATSLKPPPPR